MRLLLVAAAVVAVLVGTTSTLEIETQDVAPLLLQIPGVQTFEDVTDLLNLPGLLDVLPTTLLSPETAWDKVRAGLAGTGVAIIEIAAFIGFIFNYLDKIEKANEEQREAAAEAAAEAAEGEERFIIVPDHSPDVRPVIDIRPNIRRVDNHPALRRYPQYAAYPQARPHSRPYRRRFQKRSAAASTSDAERGGMLGHLVQAGKRVLWLLKNVFLKVAPKETVKNEMSEIVDDLTREVLKRLDHDGCLQKLVCHLRERPKDTLSHEEKMMMVFFPLRQAHADCTPDHFPDCLISSPDLDTLLTKAQTTTTNMIP